MRLHINILSVEKFLSTIARKVFNDVGILAAAVVALARITFSIFVGEDAAHRFEDGFGNEILARDQFELPMLALGFVAHGIENLGIDFGQRPRHLKVHKGNSILAC